MEIKVVQASNCDRSPVKRTNRGGPLVGKKINSIARETWVRLRASKGIRWTRGQVTANPATEILLQSWWKANSMESSPTESNLGCRLHQPPSTPRNSTTAQPSHPEVTWADCHQCLAESKLREILQGRTK